VTTAITLPSASQSDPLAALRAATGQQHALLDSSLPLSKDDATLVDYRQHLLMLRVWLLPLDRWLAAYGDGPQDAAVVPQRDYLRLVDLDLADRTMAELAPAAPAPAAASPWPAQASAAYRWGVSYVVEGSQLGGAVLYKRLAAPLAPHPLSYLRGAPPAADAPGPGPRWKAFVAALRQALTTPDEVAEAARGAVDAFSRLLSLHENEGAR
jgi:heme oxygenase